ncbi:MAG: nucleotide-binding protein [Chloroflexota bacterium]|nr:nucleotide-binding protein [Chloroflexota bacterium]MDQ5865066.1 nucleotide-binding protein [Chloroflexota bacterium]
MTLPVNTTMDDVRQIVRYLKTKATGATINEAKAAIEKALDPRKITAYRVWGIVTREGDRLKLTSLGWELARHPENEAQICRSMLDSVVPYRSMLERIYYQRLDPVTNVDVAAHWFEHHKEAIGTENENTIKDNAICFFHLCQAAKLGKLTKGRHGQATRLDVDYASMQEYIEAGPSAPPWVESANSGLDGVAVEQDASDNKGGVETETQNDATPATTMAQDTMRVFIAHGRNMDIVEQVQAMLDLADFESEVAENEETTAIPVPEKVLNAMRRCQAGIIIVSVDERRKDSTGGYALNENVLIEIGAAFVLYDRRVVLLWDKRLHIPSNLQGLYRCDFEGDELTWTAGMKLMKAIQGFKKMAVA